MKKSFIFFTLSIFIFLFSINSLFAQGAENPSVESKQMCEELGGVFKITEENNTQSSHCEFNQGSAFCSEGELKSGECQRNFDTKIPFKDVTLNDHYIQSILWLGRNDVIEGYDDLTFRPDFCVNRAEFLKMMYETWQMDLTQYEDAPLFPDTLNEVWYTPYIQTARGRDVIEGYPDGKFRPDQCMNRVEAVKMAMQEFRQIGVLDQSTEYNILFEDASEGDWFYRDLYDAVYNGFLGLYHSVVYQDANSSNLHLEFLPAEGMSRAEVAYMLYRMKQKKDNSELFNSSTDTHSFSPLPITQEVFDNKTFSIEFPKGWNPNDEEHPLADGSISETIWITEFTSPDYKPSYNVGQVPSGANLEIRITIPPEVENAAVYGQERLENHLEGFVLDKNRTEKTYIDGLEVILHYYNADDCPADCHSYIQTADFFEPVTGRRFSLKYSYANQPGLEKFFTEFLLTLKPSGLIKATDYKANYSIFYPGDMRETLHKNGLAFSNESENELWTIDHYNKYENSVDDLIKGLSDSWLKKDEEIEKDSVYLPNVFDGVEAPRIRLWNREGHLLAEAIIFDEGVNGSFSYVIKNEFGLNNQVLRSEDYYGDADFETFYQSFTKQYFASASIICDGHHISDLSDLPLQTINQAAVLGDLFYVLYNEDEAEYRLSELRKASCTSLSSDPAESLKFYVTLGLEKVNGSGVLLDEYVPIEVFVLLDWDEDQNEWKALWIDESYSPDRTTGFDLAIFPEEKRIYIKALDKNSDYFSDEPIKRYFALNINDEGKILMDFFGEENEEDVYWNPIFPDYPNYSAEYFYSSYIEGQDDYVTDISYSGARLFKKEGENYSFLGASPLKLYPISVLKNEEGEEFVYFTQFLPESGTPRWDIVRYQMTGYAHSEFEKMNIGTDFHTSQMDKVLSPDGTKIIFPQELEKGHLSILDLLKNETITVEIFDQQSDITLFGECGYGGMRAELEWINEDTFEYDVYKILNGAENVEDICNAEIEFMERRSYLISNS